MRTALMLSAAILLWPVAAAGAPAGRPDSKQPADETAAQPASAPSSPDSQPTTGTDQVKVVRLRDLLRRAITAYQRSEFEQAERQLRALTRYVRGESSREAQEIYTYLAFVQIAFDRRERAIAAFERALAARPAMKLDAPSPKVAALFEQARRRYRAKVRALDHDPPRLDHQPPAQKVDHGRRLEIAVRSSDVSAIDRVVLNYRTGGNRGFASVSMERDERAGYVATIPATAVVKPAVEYYIAAWDTLGNGPGLKGSASAPIRIQVRGGPTTSATSAKPRPWYAKWWIWAVVSGVALAAGGIATAVYLTRPERARIDLPTPVPELNP